MDSEDEEVSYHMPLDDNGIVSRDGSIEVDGLTTCLIVADVPSSIFNEEAEDGRKVFEDMFKEYGPAKFIYLKSFKRVLVNFQSSFSAAMAKLSLHFTIFREKELKVYFKKVHSGTSSCLQLPKPEKQFLISPPASPPVGWEPLEEPVPVVNYDLLSAVSALSNDPQELHPETSVTPGIVVHACPNPGEVLDDEKDYHPLNILPRRIVQTSRPPLDCSSELN